jgi:ferredoxin
VNCIHWVDYTELQKLEADREFQEIPVAGFPIDRAAIATKIRRKKAAQQKKHKIG